MPSIERDVKSIIQARQFNDSTIVPLECPLVWATESNKFNCVRICHFKSFEPEV